jgi:hypothetical protein
VKFRVKRVGEGGDVTVIETDVLDVEHMINTLLEKLSEDYVIELSIDLRAGRATGAIKKKPKS